MEQKNPNVLNLCQASREALKILAIRKKSPGGGSTWGSPSPRESQHAEGQITNKGIDKSNFTQSERHIQIYSTSCNAANPSSPVRTLTT